MRSAPKGSVCNNTKQEPSSSNQEARPTPSIMQRSQSPDTNSKHRNLLQVSGGPCADCVTPEYH